ncbi:hypothetical protein D3C72_2195960 [compost metagenome]
MPRFIDGDDRHEVSQERTSGIELAAGHDKIVARTHQLRLEGLDVLAAEFGKCIAQALSGEHGAEKVALLLFARRLADDVDDLEAVLRDLRQRGIAGGKRGKHLRQRHL